MDNLMLVYFGIIFIFLMSTLGASLVFLFRKPIPDRINTVILGFASGIMLAGAIWSLLMPAIEQVGTSSFLNILPIVCGFILGGIFLVLLDFFKLKTVKNAKNADFEIKGHKASRLFWAVTMHNIPEGMAVGLAFGNALNLGTEGAIISAFMLAVGIGVQNFPEGMAITLPLKVEYKSNKKAFGLGVLSGIVEPIFAVIGILLASSLPVIMPWMLSFAAGAMIFVVVEDLIPDAKMEKNFHLGTWGVIGGFVIMMILDVILG